MNSENMKVLTNIIGAVESGGQVYGNRRYNAYAAPYENSDEEHTITLGWAQNYGDEAVKLCNMIFKKDTATFRKADAGAGIEGMLSKNWVNMRWNPSTTQKAALIRIITTDAGKVCQDELFAELMLDYIEKAKENGVTDVGAQMMFCECDHLGGLAPTQRVFNRASHKNDVDSIFSSLLKDQNDTSNNNQIGDKKFQPRHQCCVKWIKQYAKEEGVSGGTTGGSTVTKEQAINKVIEIATAEIGYLEKRSNSDLGSKTGNAGSNNYTKYWRDIYPSYQGQPWCACFVTWVLQKAFGQNTAAKLLKHYPYVYVPTMMDVFTRYANPEVGGIVCFYHNGTFTHTGIVVAVNGDQFTTIEGNTSGGSSIIANGGGVCKKSYYNSNLPGTKFARLDWSLVSSINNSTGTSTGGTGYMFEPKSVYKGCPKSTSVYLCQEILRARGFKGKDGKALALDMECGDNLEYAINAYQAARRAKGMELGTNGKNDGCCGEKMWKDMIAI